MKSQEDVSYRNDSMKYVNEERRNPKEECEKTVEFLGLLYFSSFFPGHSARRASRVSVLERRHFWFSKCINVCEGFC